MSKIFKLNGRDLIKGLVVTVIGAVMTCAVNLLQVGFNWTQEDALKVASVALSAGLSYLLKNLMTTDNDKFLGKI